MTKESYLETIQNDILMLLIDEALSIPQLAERLKLPYTTVQQAHKGLRDDGKIIKFDRRDRGARYTLAVAGETQPRVIPKLRWGKHNLQPTEGFGSENSIPGWLKDAGEKITRSWITIAMTANRLLDGTPEAPLVRRLQAAKVDLIAARRLLENNVLIINQILDDPKFWDINYLVNFPNDPSWEAYQATLKRLYQIYYGDKNDE